MRDRVASRANSNCQERGKENVLSSDVWFVRQADVERLRQSHRAGARGSAAPGPLHVPRDVGERLRLGGVTGSVLRELSCALRATASVGGAESEGSSARRRSWPNIVIRAVAESPPPANRFATANDGPAMFGHDRRRAMVGGSQASDVSTTTPSSSFVKRVLTLIRGGDGDNAVGGADRGQQWRREVEYTP